MSIVNLAPLHTVRSVQLKLIKMGGRLVRHARRLVFRGVLEHIGRLSPTPG
jgi:hypothetical protein